MNEPSSTQSSVSEIETITEEQPIDTTNDTTIETPTNEIITELPEIETPTNDTTIETPEINTPIDTTTTQPVPEEIIEKIEEKIEEKKDELLDALTNTTEQQTKTKEQIVEEQKDEMNARNKNIEEALKKMANNIKITTIFTSKITAWKLLRETNNKLEAYLSTTLFYDIKRDWLTLWKQVLFRPKYFLDEFLESYHELNKNLGRNEYYKDIMPKYIKKDVNNPIDVADHIFINIKTQLDDTYNGIIQMEKKGGRKTKKQRKQKKQRKSKRKQRKSNRIK
jgi:hypothetical protein